MMCLAIFSGSVWAAPAFAADEAPVPAVADTRGVAAHLQHALEELRLLCGNLAGPRAALSSAEFEAHLMLALNATEPARAAWQRVEVLATAARNPSAVMQAIEQQAEAALLVSDYDASRILAERLLAVARENGSNEYQASAHGYFGVLARRQGDLDAALETYQTALQMLETSRHDHRRALILSNLGTVLRDRGSFARALELQLDALDIRERIGDRLETSLRNIALLYREIEDEETARRYFERALASVDRRSSPQTYAPVLGSHASLLNDVGDHPAALAAAGEALEIDLALGNLANQGFEHLEIGRARFGLGQADEAAAQLEQALAIGRELQQNEIVSRSLLHLAEIHQARHDSLRARGMIDEAIAGLEQAKLRPQLVQAYAVREKIALADHDPETALRFLRRHAEQRELLLGTRAGRQLSALQARHARAEADKDLALLQKDNELKNMRLDKQEVQRRLGLVMLVGLALGVLLFAWRYVGVRRLNHTLRQRNAEIDQKSKALAEANARLEERAQELYEASITDPLTGVCNRARLRDLADRHLVACQGSGRPLAALVIDYDRFKQVNDQLGHLYGDRVLIAGTRAIRECLESGDILGRFGGEEFVVLLVGDRADAAAHVAESVRAKVQQDLARLPTCGIEVTVSIGVAMLHDLVDPAGSSVDILLDAGDQAMYQAKAAGRNRVAIYRRTPRVSEDSSHGRHPATQ
jgi:diguanylate cyclase (GGDEF)-like protein